MAISIGMLTKRHNDKDTTTKEVKISFDMYIRQFFNYLFVAVF